MAFQNHLGGVRLGSVREGASANMGNCIVSQSKDITFAADGTVTAAFNIPAGSHIHFLNVDVTTAFNAATTNTFKIGTTSGGAELMTATSVGSAGRLATTNQVFSLMKNVGTSDITVYVTYNQTGTAATAGAATVAAIYSVKNADGTSGNLP